MGFPGGTVGEESACQCRRHKRRGFDPWVRKIPWRRKWQPTPGFLPGAFHEQRSLTGCSPRGCKGSDVTECTHTHTHTHTLKEGGHSGLGSLGRWLFSCPCSPSGTTNTAYHTCSKKLKVSSSTYSLMLNHRGRMGWAWRGSTSSNFLHSFEESARPWNPCPDQSEKNGNSRWKRS